MQKPKHKLSDYGGRLKAFRKSISSADREARDEAVKKAFRAGMNREQIVRLSQSWKHPIRSMQRVSQILKRLRLVRSVSAAPHVRATNDLIIDVVLDGHAKGWQTFFWEKESTVFGAVGLRSDLYVDMRKGSKTHLYVGEMQISDLTVEQWIRKLSPYLKVYDQRSHAFYVLIRCSGAYNRQRVLIAINELLKDRSKDRRPFLVWNDGWMNRSGQPQALLQ